MRNKKGSVFGGALLIAGTSIGGGMLALPVLTAAGGFIPSALLYFLCWLFMAATGLLLAEVYFWHDHEVNIVSMAGHTLGLGGKIFAWLLYLFMFYSLSVAYITGGGHLVLDVTEQFFSLPEWAGSILFVLIFAPFVIVSSRAVDRINTVLMAGLILSFLLFVALGVRWVEFGPTERINWSKGFLALPVIFTSFAFQGIVPTVTTYLGNNPKKVRQAIFWGSSIPFFTYLIWEWLILGIVPIEKLEATKALGQSAIYPLRDIIHLPWLFVTGEFLAFFALTTSFLGVTLGLLDFMADGLKVKKSWMGRLGLGCLVYLPPLAFAIGNPRIFLTALHYAGGLGSALLLGLLPILMTWVGRYQKQRSGPILLRGGKPMLTALIAFILLELSIIFLKGG